MSVTFWVPDAPRTRTMVACSSDGCSAFARCGYCYGGLEEKIESPAPELNVHNGNAAILGDLLRLEMPGGTLGLKDIPEKRRAIVRLLNTSLAFVARDASSTALPGRARIIDQGVDPETVKDRLRRLDAVFAYAQAHGWGVAWG